MASNTILYNSKWAESASGNTSAGWGNPWGTTTSYGLYTESTRALDLMRESVRQIVGGIASHILVFKATPGWSGVWPNDHVELSRSGAANSHSCWSVKIKWNGSQFEAWFEEIC